MFLGYQRGVNQKKLLLQFQELFLSRLCLHNDINDIKRFVNYRLDLSLHVSFTDFDLKIKISTRLYLSFSDFNLKIKISKIKICVIY